MKSIEEIQRLSRQKKKKRLLIILLCAMLALTVAAVVLLIVMKNDEDPVEEEAALPEIITGESYYGNYPIAYPYIEESKIQNIFVTNKASYEDFGDEEDRDYITYALTRSDEYNGSFVLSYEDHKGNLKLHYPQIVDADATFDYESLYSIEQNDGYNRIYMLTYLCVAIELPYFTDRIPLAPKGDARDAQFRGFGLDEPQATLTFDYLNAKGESVRRSVRIGDKNVTGYGYYFMVTEEVSSSTDMKTVEYREYIYNSGANYYNYAMYGFHSYVNSVLVAAGLAEDSSYEPYLTTDYKQWRNEKIDEIGALITEKSTAIVYANVFTPIEARLSEAEYEKDKDRFVLDSKLLADYESDSKKNTYLTGYIEDGDSRLELDLSKDGSYKKFAQALVGKPLGEFPDDIIVTLSTDSKNIKFENGQTIEYTYEIEAIEAILTDGEDITEPGTLVGNNNLVKLRYKLKINGVKVSDVPHHGVLDLSRESLNPAAVADIRAASVGEVNTITLDVDYNKDNAIKKNVKYVIYEIIEVYNSKGVATSVIDKTSRVHYRYYYDVDGEKSEYQIAIVDFSTDTSESAEKLKNLFVGKDLTKDEDVKELYITLLSEDSYYEYMQDFMTYSIQRADWFVKRELISAFAFLNNSQRDSFYGMSIYENKLGEDDKYGIYAINSDACESVAKKLGGIGSDSTTSNGLIGIENVAVGITPELKELYGLYAHTVYFELPRGIIVIDSGDDDTVDDYSQYQKLGFTLHISDEVYDPELGYYIRYVGSDMYDVIAKVNADDLIFLNYGFVDFWASRTLMMFDVKHLESMKIDFMFEDLQGSYEFRIPSSSKTENTFDVQVIERCIVTGEYAHAENCSCRRTKLSELKGDDPWESLSNLYTKHYAAEGEKYYSYADGKPFQLLYTKDSYDTAGVGNFKEFIGGVYSTQFRSYLGSAELSAVEEMIENGEMLPLVRISVKLDQELAKNTTKDTHIYEFYRLDDRRIVVRQYQIDDKGTVTVEPVTDFYISTLAFKRIVGNAFALLDAKTVDQDEAYPEIFKQ